ncbi:hypothetical protein VOLCADRAFT_73641 [Volvox carteri f. nagariensis]|uniref:CMP/dCMP-type deaminase domain-containing protein n=1 Tax=Volvox carteri f. nagariensis TaxID=3068 RepID=D8TP56_VOLCA|nr:uncharacterized protein VOLCADRAFT_73641 [Volvox carteri f. nagariensis]EFJ50703.1 hypothetical protein VOLCADRAFT_73641 [Volvox carteri f. nagariensis]|eukprot:XP_002948296.1 hypothetical protein VOLCADRAFT_73641 [Volvox carteri f. nagariensis]
MCQALAQAHDAWACREVPVGCVVVRDGDVVGRGHNLTNKTRNGTRHAEMIAIDQILAACGGAVQDAAFERCDLYVTVEPCIMCAGALSLLGFRKVFFGCGNDRFGGCGSILPVNQEGCGPCARQASAGTHAGRGFPAQGGLFAEQAVELLREFYAAGNPCAPRPHRPVRREA